MTDPGATHSPPAAAATPRSSGIKELIASIVCPGMGEWMAGYRTRGVGMLGLFGLAAVWLGISFYQTAFELANLVKSKDPLLAAAPDPDQALAHVARLAAGMLGEYRTHRAAIDAQIGWPLWAMAILYAISVVQAFVLARREPADS